MSTIMTKSNWTAWFSIFADKQCVRIKPDNADAYNNLGVAYLRLSDIGMALEQYQILLRLDSCKAKILHELINK